MRRDSPSTAIYRAAARLLGRTLLAAPIVRTIYVRRSVAAGEAVFPLSDLDLAMVIEPAPGAEIESLRRRYRGARVAFPRLGECQLFTPEDLEEFVFTDPYRASLDRRCAVTVLGPPPEIRSAPIPPLETARRLVFWFEHFIPTARRTGNRRNLRKFAIEMVNALGVLEGRWPEPLTSRRETLERVALPVGDEYCACLELAARAHALVRPSAPRLSAPLVLPGLVVAPSVGDAIASKAEAVVTPEVLDLLLHTQTPWLWNTHGVALARAGFQEPGRSAWIAAARRYAGGERVRGPGFLESGTDGAYARLRASASVLGGDTPILPTVTRSLSDYYLGPYEQLAAWAAALRDRARADV
ncbi:MAG: hypothetical protein ABMA00_03495 [Gemmatimonas sp.]